jgi:hypothetical protein
MLMLLADANSAAYFRDLAAIAPAVFVKSPPN